MPGRNPRKRALEFGGLDVLESRRLMSASPPSPTTSFVYTETDNSDPGQNAVIAYRRTADGRVTEIGSFKTGGTGLANPQGLLGPDDSDKEVIASPDGHLLFAVNQGSDSVAVFRVRRDGSLDLVNNRPVGSGGTQPVSLSIANGRLYVVNRGNEVQGQAGTVAPSITVFKIGPLGTLRQDVAATTSLRQGLSPSQLLISSRSNLAFLDTFTPPPLNSVPGANEVVPYRISADGKLVPAPGGGVGAPVTPPLLLGLAEHPTRNIIYAGLTGAGRVGVFTYDGGGNLKLAGTAPVEGGAPCWSLVGPDGRFLYTVDTGTNSVGVFSLADPLRPAQVQEFALGGPQNPSGNPSDPRETTDFEFALDPTGDALYVINHSTDAAGHFPQGNALHVLTVAADGTLSEGAGSPRFLPPGIPAGAAPQGVAVIAASRRDGRSDGHD
ncbi:Lactonase, 7-bladed beta-propeller (plasmid) [Aquisphaera giovannonii]|uniref:Lactonase, 7-bladed beta-propeller n=1 Tax=Aquisphaera giovannonii TaxID=406548 RepID=A0A5B9WFJ2_9BACT|nr:beta-propeller fold lactonase family protein [Aquisphaera giovannonii]QEH39243.1 Lactonase, 7-bladed beta-propeller [Aquisphaera giovannonii]